MLLVSKRRDDLLGGEPAVLAVERLYALLRLPSRVLEPLLLVLGLLQLQQGTLVEI